MGRQQRAPRFGVGPDVLAAWIGSCAGSWIGLTLGGLASMMLETRATEGLADLSESLMVLALCLVGGGLTGAAAGATLALKAIGVDRAVANGVISLWLLVTAPVVWTVGSLLFPFVENGNLLASAVLATAEATFLSSFIVRAAASVALTKRGQLFFLVGGVS